MWEKPHPLKTESYKRGHPYRLTALNNNLRDVGQNLTTIQKNDLIIPVSFFFTFLLIMISLYPSLFLFLISIVNVVTDSYTAIFIFIIRFYNGIRRKNATKQIIFYVFNLHTVIDD